jgi:hypothetical protein
MGNRETQLIMILALGEYERMLLSYNFCNKEFKNCRLTDNNWMNKRSPLLSMIENIDYCIINKDNLEQKN